MSVGRTRGSAAVGITAAVVDVEADVAQGLPSMTIVGLADAAVREAHKRVRAAMANSEVEWAERKITVALLPASWKKRGSGLDLPIALAILAATGQVPAERAAACLVVGELGLDGSVRPVPGVIIAALAAHRAGIRRVLVPTECVSEARLIPDLDVGGVSTLDHLVAVLRGLRLPDDGELDEPREPPATHDLADIRGQSEARRALEIAAAGAHHLSMVGPPGVGKSMLAQALPSILPPLDDDAAVEVTAIRSAAGVLDPGSGLVRIPPFVTPHQSASHVAIVGGGQNGRVSVGAATLAHRGVLFLDEAPEFNRSVIEALRLPLETGQVHLSRADLNLTLPARFHLVLAANPCKCGKAIGRGEDCSCSSRERRAYAARLSGPVLDRIDIRLLLARPTPHELTEEPEGSARVAERVVAARDRARRRWLARGWTVNGQVPGPALRRHWPPTDEADRLLAAAITRGAMSLRGADRVLRVAWTLADLDGVDRPGIDQVAYAMSLRGEVGTWAA